MGNEFFDASIGLAFSLAAFEKYKKNGLLQAELHHVPGIPGRCKGYVHITQGKVIDCSIEDRYGQRHATQLQLLIQVDNDKGPFGWTLTEAPQPVTQHIPVPASRPSQTLNSASSIPKIIALLNLEQLSSWTPAHKQVLFQVYQAIDSRSNIERIKQTLPFPPYITEEALHVLLILHIITFA